MNRKKTIAVVGAGKGMGNHIAKEFAKNDFRVVLIARNQESLDSYIKEFETEGIECRSFVADAADTASLTNAFADVEKVFGTVDVLVYNAAVLTAGTPTSLTSEDLIAHYQVDVASALHCAKLVIPGQEEAGEGTLLFTGGGLALNPMAEYACVSVGKSALRTLAFVLNQELKDKGIFTGIVTIKGNVEPGTHYDPSLIAKEYWKLYKERTKVEIIY